MPGTTSPVSRVGVVGGGQLARMMGEESHHLNIELVVLATSNEDCAISVADHVMLGAANDESALWALSQETDVLTFDHELVDLDVLARLETQGVTLRPSSSSLRYSVDKSYQRERFAAAGFPLPGFAVLRDANDLAVLEGWTSRFGSGPVLKAARGGYDGRGVLFPKDDDEARNLARELLASGTVVVEERMLLQSEVSQLVVRSVRGEMELYPLVTTVQSDGMCAEVRFPCELPPSLHAFADELSRDIAEAIGLVGVMAVEYFVTTGGLLINELALRPHNSGHWTIEGCATSQFANHLRAVTGQDLGACTPLYPAAVMVNVVGAQSPGSLDAARRVPGVRVHDYGKAWRPGRKLGHVTAFGDHVDELHVTAWQSARAYGTNTQEA
ncbi:MAG: 5-(carboxyamino)imidazole ribonucleotide synthase [Acidimicrobiaceae bacterium]|nr:5-(carboxyamino)imidazole ribonucleotide synthase [Acidimicrobiaceae bacterium]